MRGDCGVGRGVSVPPVSGGTGMWIKANNLQLFSHTMTSSSQHCPANVQLCGCFALMHSHTTQPQDKEKK